MCSLETDRCLPSISIAASVIFWMAIETAIEIPEGKAIVAKDAKLIAFNHGLPWQIRLEDSKKSRNMAWSMPKSWRTGA